MARRTASSKPQPLTPSSIQRPCIATPSKTDLIRSPLLLSRLRLTKPPRTVVSGIGERSPYIQGQNSRPFEPGSASAALSFSQSYTLRPWPQSTASGATSSANHLKQAPALSVSASSMNFDGSADAMLTIPLRPSLIALGIVTAIQPEEPMYTCPWPSRTAPEPTVALGTSPVPTNTGTPAGRPISSAEAAVSSPALSEEGATRGIFCWSSLKSLNSIESQSFFLKLNIPVP